MKTTLGLPVEKLRAELQPSLEACVLMPCNFDCPLFKLRSLFVDTRHWWLDALTEEDLTYLAAYHHVCQQVTLESRRAQCA